MKLHVQSSGKLLIACALVLVIGAFVLFMPKAVLVTALSDGNQQQIARIFKKHEILNLDKVEIARDASQGRKISIATSLGNLDFVLMPHDMRATNYRAEETIDDGTVRLVESGPIRTFRGTVDALNKAEARFTVDEDTFEGVIIGHDELYFIEPAQKYVPSANQSDFILYKASDIKEPLGSCGTTLNDEIRGTGERLVPQISRENSLLPNALSSFNIELATEADYEFVTAFGGSSGANSEILAIMNQVEGVYQSELGLSFTIAVSAQHTWNTSGDPYVSTDPSTMLREFRDYWNANFNNIGRDLAHMWTGRNMDGSTVGIASVGVVCRDPSRSYALSEKRTVTLSKFILTAHEIGHNFNAHHSNDVPECANTIMQSSIGTGFTFCQFSRDEITTFANENSSCLTGVPIPCQNEASTLRNRDGGPPIHPPGSVVKTSSSSTVYLIDPDNRKRPITSSSVLAQLYNQSTDARTSTNFTNWVITVGQDELDLYEQGGNISAAQPGNGRPFPDGKLIGLGSEVSIVSGLGGRRPFATESTFTGLGFKFCQVVNVSSAEYNSYPAGPPVEAMPLLVTSLSLFPAGPYTVGQSISGSFTIKNVGYASLPLSKLGIAGRFNENPYDISFDTTTIAAGASYPFGSQARQLSTAGTYEFSAAYQEANQHWSLRVPANPGVIASRQITVNQTTDTTGPNLSITSHTNGQTVSSSSITLSGTASDSGRGNNGISSVTVNGLTATGGTASGSGTANWSRSVTLNQGSNTIAVVARDNSSNQNTTTQSITINYQPADTTGPNLSITSHTNGQTVSSSSITLAGTASDSGRGNNGISSVTVNGANANGGTASGSSTANWNRSVSLNQGANNITVVARDNSSNQNSTSQSITINYQPPDSTGPNLSINSHSNGQTVSASTIDLFGTASDSGRGNNGISSVTVNGVNASGGTASGSSTANWSRSLTLNQGTNNITVVARDNSSNQNSTTQSITINYQPPDSTAPNLSINSHSNGQTVSASTIDLFGTASDSGRGNNGISSVTVNGGAASGGSATGSNTANWSRSLTLNQGANNITVVARDNSSNQNSTTQSITINYQPPPSGTAIYDGVLKAPKCGQPGNVCDSGTLLDGRDNISGGPETNQPNTIFNSCADSSVGTYHVDESIDRIKLSTVDGSNFSSGKTVKVEATVWAWSGVTSDFLDLYYANNAANPTWTYLTTLAPSVAGVNLLSTTYTLPSGSLQALRAHFRWSGSASPCGGVDTFNDYDDLIFAVGADPSQQIQLLLEQFGPVANQALALDAILMLRDPFPVLNNWNALNSTSDKNTRVVVYLSNFQLAPGEASSSVVVNLIDSLGQSFDVAAQDVRGVPNSSFTQVTFRLPANLAVGTCTISVKARGQTSNSGTIRIRA